MAVVITYEAHLDEEAVAGDPGILIWEDAPIGTAAADRLVFACITTLYSNSPATAYPIEGVTIGGVAATIAITDEALAPSVFSATTVIAWAAVPSGTVADIELDYGDGSEPITLATLDVYSVIGADTTTPVVDSAIALTGTYPGGETGLISVVLDIPPSGGALAKAMGPLYGTAADYGWTGLTEDQDGIAIVPDIGHGTASIETGPALINTTIEVTAGCADNSAPIVQIFILAAVAIAAPDTGPHATLDVTQDDQVLTSSAFASSIVTATLDVTQDNQTLTSNITIIHVGDPIRNQGAANSPYYRRKFKRTKKRSANSLVNYVADPLEHIARRKAKPMEADVTADATNTIGKFDGLDYSPQSRHVKTRGRRGR